MSLPAVFKLTEAYSPELLDLLQQTQLGTKGAIYRHLDTSKRINELVHPLFLYIQRNQRVLSNITFCRRTLPNNSCVYYIRYFAFDKNWSASGKKSETKKDTLLRKGIHAFFQTAFDGQYGEKPELFYAYIEPNNSRSMWMAESFQFLKAATINTFALSRFFPKTNAACVILDKELTRKYSDLLYQTYQNHHLFFPHHTLKDAPIYGYIENGKLVAACKVHIVNWEIIRLPGNFGKLLTQMIPYIPLINRIIKPKHHRFTVVEGIISQGNHKHYLNPLFEHILADTKTNLMLTWYDTKDTQLASQLKNVHKGVAKHLVGNSSIQLMTKTPSESIQEKENPYYISAFDLI